jgi:small subunit ribosomal protein S2
MIDFRELIKAGSHFGHQTSRWCPKMAPYIWGSNSKVHLIDVSKMAFNLEKAARFLGEEIAANNKQILFVGTKRPAQKVIEEVAKKLDMPYVNHRWIGGTLSNFEQVKKSVTRLLHYEDVLSKSQSHTFYTKKELNVFQKLVTRLEKSVGGIRTLKWPVGAIVIVDVGKEASALLEARSMGVPVVAIVDTNCDPTGVDFVIPCNDDAPTAIEVVINYLAQSVEKGKTEAAKKTAAAQEKARMVAAEKKETAAPADNKKVEAKKVVAAEPKAKKAEDASSAAPVEKVAVKAKKATEVKKTEE